MASRSSIRIAIAVGLVAIVLIFLGLNFVPRIFARSSDPLNLAFNRKSTRLDFLNENHPQAIFISPRSSQIITSSLYYARSDWIERHPSNYYANLDWIDRHPSNYYTNSDWIERHPSNYYNNSDWIERHPS